MLVSQSQDGGWQTSYSHMHHQQDHPVPIGYGETISAPHMHAEALRLLEDHCIPGASVLDVGSGSLFNLRVATQKEVVSALFLLADMIGVWCMISQHCSQAMLVSCQ